MNTKATNTAQLVEFLRTELSPYYPEKEGNAIIFRLFEGILSYEQTDIVLNAESTVSKADQEKFENAVQLLKKKTPVQYILGYTDFYNVRINVDKRALIPRPETEELVDWIVKESGDQVLRILDVGTGSGCIAIALKKHLQNSQVMGVDVSDDCIDLAKENAEANQVDVNFRVQDIVDRDGSAKLVQPETLDIIVSNPPYIQYKDRYQMDENILSYEPSKALFVDDENPLLFYKLISLLGSVALKKDGQLYFEINEKYGDEVVDVLKKAGYVDVEQRKDIHDSNRFVRGIKE